MENNGISGSTNRARVLKIAVGLVLSLALFVTISVAVTEVAKANAAKSTVSAVASLNDELISIQEEIDQQKVHDNTIQTLIDTAKSYIGTPYKSGGETPAGFDCSGFTKYCYAQIGYDLPHNAAAQSSYGMRVSRDELQTGDLVFFGSGINHVGMYVGNGQFIHSPRTGEYVRIDDLDARSNYVGACRLI